MDAATLLTIYHRIDIEEHSQSVNSIHDRMPLDLYYMLEAIIDWAFIINYHFRESDIVNYFII